MHDPVAQVHGEGEHSAGPKGGARAPQGGGELRGCQVDERVPGDDRAPRRGIPRTQQLVEPADREVEVGEVRPRLRDHRRRSVQPVHLHVLVGEEGRDLARSAAQVHHRAVRHTGDAFQQPDVERLLRQLVEQCFGVGAGCSVVGGQHAGVPGRRAIRKHQLAIGGRCAGVRRGGHRAEQVDPARVASTLQRELAHQRRVGGRHRRKTRLHLGAVGERVQALGARLQLTRGLRPAQQQDGDHGQLLRRERQFLLEQLVVLHRPRARAGPHQPQQVSVLQRSRGVLDGAFVVVDDRVAAVALVAREAQGVQRKGIAGGHGSLLLQQAAQHPLFLGGKNR